MRTYCSVKRKAGFVTTLFILFILGFAGNFQAIMLDYSVISIDKDTWIATAKESVTGKEFQFKLTPSVFEDMEFNFNPTDTKPEEKITLSCSRDICLENLIMETPIPGGTINLQPDHQIKNSLKPSEEPLDWITTNMSEDWIVTVCNQMNGKILSFQAHPEAFTGFRFKASVRVTRKGETFSIIVPKDNLIKNAFTFIKNQ